MSTHAHVGFYDEDQYCVYYTYVHQDGYPEYLGHVLDTYYSTKFLATRLSMSDKISNLKSKLGDSSFLESEMLWTPCSLSDYMCHDAMVDYVYLYMDNKWHILQNNKDPNAQVWVPLKLLDLPKISKEAVDYPAAAAKLARKICHLLAVEPDEPTFKKLVKLIS
jgi:hypothetical protein